MEVRPCARFAIVGVGPRGLSVFERICANWERTAAGRVIDVVLIDSVAMATGGVWRVDQPAELLMNTVASQITVFTDDSVHMRGPVRRGPSLYEWACHVSMFELPGIVSDAVLDEAGRMTPDSYPTRAFYGHYLRWAYGHIRHTAAARVRVREIIDTVVDLRDGVRGQVLKLAGGRRIENLDAVVLAQGHLPTVPDSDAAGLAEFAEVAGLTYMGPGNAADIDPGERFAGEPVILRGLGLTFFDYLSMFTTGRGGRFVRRDGALEYRPSGREPIMYVGSRRGVPYHARGENQKGVATRHLPILLTEAKIRQLHQRSRNVGDVDFRRDVWPLIAREVEIVYYARVLHDRTSPRELRGFRNEFAVSSAGESEAVLRRYGVTARERWDWTRVVDPLHGRRFDDSAAFQQWLLGYLAEDARLARLGNVEGAVKAALDVLRDLRNEIRLVVDHSGITGRSYRHDLDQWYTPLNAFLSIGPPLRRIEEMAAAMRAGVVTLVGPGMRVTAAGAEFVAESAAVAGSRVSARCLIDARLPEPDIRQTTDALIRNLIGRGEARCYTVSDPDGDGFRTGGMEVTLRHAVVDRAGRPHARRFALGVPTEKVHWVTAAGPRPGVNSVTLSDADEVARRVLDCVPAQHFFPYDTRAGLPVKETNDA